MTDARPYATLLAKGEDRRQLILVVARRLLVRYGWRNTTLGRIARDAGVSPAGLLHHFESKEQLLHAVLEVRDEYDDAYRGKTTDEDVLERIEGVADRFERVPELVGMYVVLLIEHLDPDAPLHDRLFARYHAAVDTIADGIRRGQRAGRFRTDLDPAAKAVEIVAFLYGMETSWLLDPSIPVREVFREYVRSLAHRLTSPGDVR